MNWQNPWTVFGAGLKIAPSWCSIVNLKIQAGSKLKCGTFCSKLSFISDHTWCQNRKLQSCSCPPSIVTVDGRRGKKMTTEGEFSHHPFLPLTPPHPPPQSFHLPDSCMSTPSSVSSHKLCESKNISGLTLCLWREHRAIERQTGWKLWWLLLVSTSLSRFYAQPSMDSVSYT